VSGIIKILNKSIYEKRRNGGRKMLEKMRKIISEQLDIEESEITLDSNFKDDLDADSLDLFELLTTLEEQYDIEIPAEDMESLTTVGNVIDYLKTKGIEA
jgi:acyl carrier protein